MLVTSVKNFEDAKSACENDDSMRLAIVNTPDKQEQIVNFVKTTESDSRIEYWIGLHKTSSSVYEWIDGTPLTWNDWKGNFNNPSTDCKDKKRRCKAKASKRGGMEKFCEKRKNQRKCKKYCGKCWSSNGVFLTGILIS